MRQAIETRFLGPTNHRGARVTARANAGRVTIGWNFESSVEQNHWRAAEALAVCLGWAWGDHWVCGGSADGLGYVFVDSST